MSKTLYFGDVAMRIPKYRKHSSSGQARVTLNGKTYYLGRFGSKESKLLYNRLVGEFVASDGAMIAPGQVDTLTMSEMLLAYVKFAENHYGKDSGELDDLKRVIRRLRDSYGPTIASDFG